MRAHLAAAAGDAYAEACDALAAYRDFGLRQRASTSFLLPTQADWVEEDSVR